MFGTIARLEVRPDAEARLREEFAVYEQLDVPGFVSSAVYRADDERDVYWLAVVFEDRASYERNANDPKQDERYRRLRALLRSDPEWHDGEIVSIQQGTPARAR